MAVADLVVLSKTDLVMPEQVVQFEERLRAINPGVRLFHAVRGEGAAGHLWGLSGLGEGSAPADVLAWAAVPKVAPDPLANLSGLFPQAPEPTHISPHDTRIGSASIVLDEPLGDEVFDTWLNTLIGLRGSDILRVKGIVFLEGIDFPFVFHGVQHAFEPLTAIENCPGGDRRSRIVVIGRDISRPELQRSLDMLRAPPRPADNAEAPKEVTLP